MKRAMGPALPVSVKLWRKSKGLHGGFEVDDVEFDPTYKLSLRFYKPRDYLGSILSNFCYFQGGGFYIGSLTWPNCQNYCLRLTSELWAVIISPDYRLAPENHFPAAIDDTVSTIKSSCPGCRVIGGTNSPTSTRHGDGLRYIRIWTPPPWRLVF